jgi:hypothetical protein
MSAHRLKPIEQMVVDTAVRMLVDHGIFWFAELKQELGNWAWTKGTLRKHVEEHPSINMQLMPVQLRFQYKSEEQQRRRWGGKAYDPNDEMDAKHFVASSATAAGYCRPKNATEAMRRYWQKGKDGKAVGAVKSRERTIDTFNKEGVALEPPVPRIPLPPSLL